MSKVIEYFQHVRKEMLCYIPAGSSHIVDIGCGAGSFGELLKHDEDVEVWGVEYNPAAAEEARTVLDRVLTGSAESALSELPQQYFDCVVFNDVLEHLVDPYTVLDRAKSLLTPAGVVVASIPNARHWPVFVDYVFKGNWEYRNQGVLDKTHLRFFTKNSILKTFDRCGYEVLNIEGINPYYSRWQKLACLATANRLEDTKYLQFAVVAHPRTMESL